MDIYIKEIRRAFQSCELGVYQMAEGFEDATCYHYTHEKGDILLLVVNETDGFGKPDLIRVLSDVMIDPAIYGLPNNHDFNYEVFIGHSAMGPVPDYIQALHDTNFHDEEYYLFIKTSRMKLSGYKITYYTSSGMFGEKTGTHSRTVAAYSVQEAEARVMEENKPERILSTEITEL